VFDIAKEDRGYLLSSDGLFDELSVDEVRAAEQVLKGFEKSKDKHPSEIIHGLLNTAVETAAKSHSLSLAELLEVPVGRTRRNLHDDMTLVFVSLASQATK